MKKYGSKLLDLSSAIDEQQIYQTSTVLWMVFGPMCQNVIKTADLGSSMDGFGTVRKKQPKSQILMVLSISLGSGAVVDFLLAFL